MRRVIDASVAFKWVVPEADTDKALLVRENFRNSLDELLAPDLFPIEVAHGLTRAERQGRIAVTQAGLLLADVLTTLPILYPSLPLLLRACEISSQMRVGIYDSLYIALAERERCEFLTADDKLAKHLGTHFAFIVPLASLP